MLRGILAVLSWLYATGVVVRNAAFAAGILRAERIEVPVISVGNITAGGTGKTPLVEHLIAYCIARGKRVGVVSRGYGRTTRGVRVVSDGRSLLADAATGGDEPVQMACRFPPALIVVGERRVDAALTAVRELGATVVLMDDGFQHRYLQRDLDIVVVDAGRNVSREPLLPLGRRREPLRAFRRAGLVMFSHVPNTEAVRAAGEAIAPWYRGATAGMKHVYEGLCTMAGMPADPGLTERGTGFAFCGVGDPEGFLETLREAGIRIAGHAWFPDHHRYSRGDIDEVEGKAETHGASFLITTEKDAARLRSNCAGGSTHAFRFPVVFLRITITITEGEGEFHRAVDRCLGASAQG